MLKKIVSILLLFFSTFLWGSLFGDEKEVVIPKHTVQISGEKYLDKSQMYDALGIEHKSILQFWKNDTAYINDKLLPTLDAALRAYYDSEGFYDAEYTIKETNTTVRIEVKENEAVKIDDINISSDFDIKPFILFQKGEVFQAKKFIAIKNDIMEQLLKEGYCSYELDTKAYIDLDTHKADIRYSLKKGGMCTFGEVTVKGNKNIDVDVIKSRVRAEKGARFSTELVQDTSDALYGLQAFDSVLVSVDRKFYNVVPVDISVTEMEKPYSFEAGLGYDSYVGARVHSALTKYNFMGGAQKLKFELAWSQLEQTAVVSFYRPVLFDIEGYYIGIGGRLGYTNLTYDGFQEEKSFVKTYLEYTSKRTTLRVGMAFEAINIKALDNLRSGQALQFAVNEGNFLLTYPYVDYTYDARDSKLNPKFGYYVHLYSELGLSNEDTSIYQKSLLEGRFIHTFDKLTLAAVGIVGTIDEQTKKSLPESKYFFAGGAFSNRAYGFRELGVILSPTVDTIYGASTWANVSLEADYPMWGNLYGAVFTDNTMLTSDTYDFTGEVISSAGLGVRYMTPIGPFKLDIGMNVADRSQYAVSFQIGQSF